MSDGALKYASKHMLDKEKLQRLLPKGTSHKVTDEIIALVQNMENDTGLIQDYLEESLLSHLPVLREIKVDLDDYVNAIKYCNLKRNMTNEKAWEITFPERYRKLHEEGRWNTSHVSMYNSSAIVTKIDAQMMIATHIQYAPMFHAAVMKQFDLMNGKSADGEPVSPHVQHLSAKTLAELTAAPVEQKVDIKIGQSDDVKSQQEKTFRELEKIALQQQELLRQGIPIEQVQRLNLKIQVDADTGEDEEVIDVDED